MNNLIGRGRLDKLDLRLYRTSNDAPEKILFQHTILDAANNYLFFGLSNKNGVKINEFWFAYEYFFNIRSYEPDTWKHTHVLKSTAVDEILKKRVTKTVHLTDEQIKAMCFDTHFYIANIRLSMDVFLRELKRRRTAIIEENWEQIKNYLLSLQTKTPNCDIINPIDTSKWKRILLSPESPEELVQLVNLRAAEKKKDVKRVNGNISDIGSFGDSSNSELSS